MALGIVADNLMIPLPYSHVDLGFVVKSVQSAIFGPVWSGLAAGVGNVVGYMIFPSGGPFFAGYILSDALAAVFYGMFMYKREPKIWRAAAATALVTFVVNIGLNTLWMSMMTGKAAGVILMPRIIRNLIMLPIQAVIVYVVWRIMKRIRIFEKFA